jgi:hypothetical protein
MAQEDRRATEHFAWALEAVGSIFRSCGARPSRIAGADLNGPLHPDELPALRADFRVYGDRAGG